MDWLLSHVRLLFFSIIPCSNVGVVVSSNAIHQVMSAGL